MKARERRAHDQILHASEVERMAMDAYVRHDYGKVVSILMQGYGKLIRSLCIALLRDADLAEDVRQRIFLDAYESLDTFDVTEKFCPWLRAIARHRCLDEIKARSRRQSRVMSCGYLPDVADPSRSSEDVLTYNRYTIELDVCLGKLPEKARVAVILCLIEDLSYPEMAKLLKEPPATLHARVTRALRRLKCCLRARGVTP